MKSKIGISLDYIASPKAHYDMASIKHVDRDALKTTIAHLVGVQANAFDIIDANDDGLVLIHPKAAVPLSKNEASRIRGLIVDTNNLSIACGTLGYSSEVVAESLEPNEAGDLFLTDNFGVTHHISAGSYRIKMSHEGPMIRVFRHNGKSYIASHKKIDASRSRFGQVNFVELYHKFGGPDPDTLFQKETRYSPYTYYFMPMTGSVITGTRQIFTSPDSGYTVSLGVSVNWYPGPKAPYYVGPEDHPDRKADSRPSAGPIRQTPLSLGEDIVPGPVVDENLGLIEPFYFEEATFDETIQSANRFLKEGFYTPIADVEDIRAMRGETIIVEIMGDTPERQVGSIKVVHPSFAWRNEIRSGDPVPYHRFVMLAAETYTNLDKVGWEKWDSMYIRFPLYNLDKLKNNLDPLNSLLSIAHGTTAENRVTTQRQARLHLLTINYAYSLPIHLQKEALDYMERFNRDRNMLVKFLVAMEGGEIEFGEEKPLLVPHPRMNAIVRMASNYANMMMAEGRNRSRKGEIHTREDILRGSIFNAVNEEKGNTLYQMIRQSQRYPEFKPQEL